MKQAKKHLINIKTKNEFFIKFGEHLRKLRTERGLSQEKLAKRCNSYTKKISRTERGEYNFSYYSLVVLAKGLNISIEELVKHEYPDNLLERLWVSEKKDPEDKQTE